MEKLKSFNLMLMKESIFIAGHNSKQSFITIRR